MRKGVNVTLVCNNNLCQEFGYFSKYSKCIRMLTWIYRFFEKTHNKVKFIQDELTLEEVKRAEVTLKNYSE